ncbi:unnamed protein product [Hermetia illucens]|uniref:PiggyBac transposable element-derived protein domain-containing protein n=1 Tax=Hermetia illucens TaxID=343691 RepID=A0A7R8UFL7_HERIL|nr:unnamed protein product [Hermetia illucens]
MDFIEVAESFSDEDEEVSEIEDYESGDKEIEVSDDDLEEIILEDLPEYLSRDKTIQWYEHPFRHSRRSTNPSLQPGITRYTASRISDIQSSFDLFLPPQLETIILRNTNREGRRVLGATFEDIDTPTLRAYIGLLILAGVYRSNNEATESLWDAEIGRPIFRAVMSNKTFKKISRFIRFDDRSTRSSRRETDKFAPIRELWDSWGEVIELQLTSDCYNFEIVYNSALQHHNFNKYLYLES